MKVYAAPTEIALPEPDYSNYNHEVQLKREEDYKQAIKDLLLSQGFTGKHTGDILYIPMGDGAAEYMFADGKKSFLIHLPIGDAWDSRDVQFLPKKEVIRRLVSRKNMTKLFSLV